MGKHGYNRTPQVQENRWSSSRLTDTGLFEPASEYWQPQRQDNPLLRTHPLPLPPAPRRNEISSDLTHEVDAIRRISAASRELVEPGPRFHRASVHPTAQPQPPDEPDDQLALIWWQRWLAVTLRVLAHVGVVAAATVCAAGALAWWLRWEFPPLVSVVALGPFLVVLGLVGILGAVATRRLSCLLVLLVATGLLVASQVPLWRIDAAAAAASSSPAALQLRVATVTLGPSTTAEGAAAVVAMARSHRLDLLSVQGLSLANRDLLAQAGLDTVFGYVHAVVGTAPSGTGLWSRTPLTGSDQWAIPEAVVLRTNLALPNRPAGGSLALVATNLDQPSGEQQQAMREQLGRVSGPVVALGQWAAASSAVSLRRLQDQGLANAEDQAGQGWVRTHRPQLNLPKWLGGASALLPWPTGSTQHILVGSGDSSSPGWQAVEITSLDLGSSTDAALLAVLALQA